MDIQASQSKLDGNGGKSRIPILSICIPTYNRIRLLRRTVAALLPQLTVNCELVVVDNCSPQEVAPAVEDLVSKYGNMEIRLLRNPVNVGGGANALRCFELARGDWVWVLGDDDEPSPDAIQNILEEITTFPDAVFINFASALLDQKNITRRATSTTTGLEGFVNELDDFGNLLCISAGVYRRDNAVSNLSAAYLYVHTCAVHLCVLLFALMVSGGVTVFSRRTIFYWKQAEAGEMWDESHVLPMLYQTLELFHDVSLREIWFEKLKWRFPAPLLSPSRFFLRVIRNRGDAACVRNEMLLAHFIALRVRGFRSRLAQIQIALFFGRYFWWVFVWSWQLQRLLRGKSKEISGRGVQSSFSQKLIADRRR